MNVADMPAGRELDALVTKVLRGDCLHDPVRSDNISRIGTGALEYQCRRCGEVLDEGVYFADAYDPWKPSENLNQAFELWGEFARRQQCLQKLEEVSSGEWAARCGDGASARARGETPAVAICRAILVALGVTDGADVE